MFNLLQNSSFTCTVGFAVVHPLYTCTCNNKSDDQFPSNHQVKGQIIPVHGFVLASRSPKCHQLICENKENFPQASNKRTQTIVLHESIDYVEVVNWLKRLYGGLHISDKELFPNDVSPTKSKNGYHGITKAIHEKKALTETDRESKGKKIELEDGGKNLIEDHLLADFIFLSTTDLDDYSAPTVDFDDMLLDNASCELVQNSSLDVARTKHSKGRQSQQPIR